MRRLPAYARWAVGIVTLVVVALCAGAALAPPPPPANVYVDAAGLCKGKVPCYTTIQAGVDAAVPGDVVLVSRGTYHEHVLVAKAITLLGDSKSGAVIDGDGTGTVVTLAESGATLSQLAVKHGLVGVNVSGSSGNTLSDLKVSDCDNGAVPPAERLGRGIFFSGSASGNIVQDTEVTGSGLYAIDVGDQLNENNQFLRLKLHKNPGKGFNAYGVRTASC